MAIKENIGQKIITLRKENKISQRKLADISGINLSYISQIENGLYNPSIEYLERIFGVFGKEIEDIVLKDSI